MKKIFWILVLGAIGSAAMAVGLGNAQDNKGLSEARESR